MTNNFLLLNPNKTEVLLLGPKAERSQLSKFELNLDGHTVIPSNTVKNLGVIFDSSLSFGTHVCNIVRTAFFHLYKIAKQCNILSLNDAEKPVPL